MYESNASENIHVMVSLNCPYVLDIKIEVYAIQKILLLSKSIICYIEDFKLFLLF